MPEVTPAERVVETAPPTVASFERFEHWERAALYLIDEYWSRAFPRAFGRPYETVATFSYFRPPESEGLACGILPPDTSVLARYCVPDDDIAWSDPWLFSLYLEYGEAAVGFILAHEWGHAVATRAEIRVEATILGEQVADCLAGAWFGDLRERGRVRRATEDRVEGLPWAEFPETGDVTHGPRWMRHDAFYGGFLHGPASCAEFGSWAGDRPLPYRLGPRSPSAVSGGVSEGPSRIVPGPSAEAGQGEPRT